MHSHIKRYSSLKIASKRDYTRQKKSEQYNEIEIRLLAFQENLLTQKEQ